ncbi:MAG: DUF2459 domain-containing protein, partial [Burkholderiaceae bacterium]
MATRTLNRYRGPSPLTQFLRGIGYCVAAVILIAAIYITAAIALGALPVNASFTETPDGIPIYLRTNGVHAELILPTRTESVDWSIDHPPVHMRALAEPHEWIAFGWGDLGFFANTPTWADLKLGTALTALSGLG